jgi:hypothetical protein
VAAARARRPSPPGGPDRAERLAIRKLDRLLSTLGLDPALLDGPQPSCLQGRGRRFARVSAGRVLLDEPTSGDPQAGARRGLIRFQMLAGRMVVLVTTTRSASRGAYAISAGKARARRRHRRRRDRPSLPDPGSALLLVVNGAISLAFELRLRRSRRAAVRRS